MCVYGCLCSMSPCMYVLYVCMYMYSCASDTYVCMVEMECRRDARGVCMCVYGCVNGWVWVCSLNEVCVCILCMYIEYTCVCILNWWVCSLN